MFRLTELVFVVASWSLASAHTVIVYPKWRGNNIISNGTKSEEDKTILPGSIGINYLENGTKTFPWGMQWMYPCTLRSISIAVVMNDELTAQHRRRHAHL